MSADNTHGPGFHLVPSGEDLVVSGDEFGTYTLWRVTRVPSALRPARELRSPVASSPSLGTIRAAMRLLGASEG
jgi:hypothetical protein